MNLISFFLKKSLPCKRQDFCSKIVENCFLWSRYGAGTGTVTCQNSEPDKTVSCQKSEPEPEL
jgi:hypothetical protein